MLLQLSCKFAKAKSNILKKTKNFEIKLSTIMKNLLALFIFLFSTVLFAQNDGWKYMKTTDGINVYIKNVEGSAIKQIKLQTHFNRKMSVMVAALQDVPSYPKWVYKASYSEKIKSINSWETIYYNYLDFPWPIKDRDVVVYNKIDQNPKTRLVVSSSFAQKGVLPTKENIFRIEDMHSQWILKSEASGVYAEYYFSSNPGGDIPNWSINAAMDDGPIKTIQGLKKLINTGQFDAAPNKLIVD